MKKLVSFERFTNESARAIYAGLFDPKLDKASRLIGTYLSKKIGGDFRKFPFTTELEIDGRTTRGIMFYNNRGNDAFFVGGNDLKTAPGIVGSLMYFADHSNPVATFIISSENFPIVALLNEFVKLVKDQKYAKEAVMLSESVNEKRARHKFTDEEIKEVQGRLSNGDPATQISRDMNIPYSDILKVRDNVGAVERMSPQEKLNNDTLENKVKFLEEVMEDIYQITRRVGAGAFNSLFISGRAGTGKTFTVTKALEDEGLEEGEDWILVSGAASVIMMYKTFYQFKNKTIVFDDCDAVFRDENGRNLMKAALDTKRVRKISYLKKSGLVYDPKDFDNNPEGMFNAEESGLVPNRFDFEGRVIFISNLDKDKADPDGAIRSRSILVDVNPDDATLMERMKMLLPHLEPKELPLSEKQEIYEFMKDAKDISMRTFVKAAGFKMAGLSQWKRMAQRYL